MDENDQYTRAGERKKRERGVEGEIKNKSSKYEKPSSHLNNRAEWETRNVYLEDFTVYKVV